MEGSVPSKKKSTLQSIDSKPQKLVINCQKRNMSIEKIAKSYRGSSREIYLLESLQRVSMQKVWNFIWNFTICKQNTKE